MLMPKTWALIVVRFDLIEGLTFASEPMRQRYEEICRLRLGGQPSLGVVPPTPSQPPAPPTPDNAVAPPPRANPGALRRPVQTRPNPEDAFGDLRVVVAQDKVSIFISLDMSDMLVSDPDRYSPEERYPLILLKRALLDAAILREGDLAGYRNTVVLIADELKRVPLWLSASNPLITSVQVSAPSREERLFFGQNFGQHFYDGEALAATPTEFQAAIEEFADLTDGFLAQALESVRKTSWQQRISLATPRQLVDYYRHNRRDDPFEQLNADKVASARDELSKPVIGQPRAIDAVTSILVSSKVGISFSAVGGRNNKPKGTFFFAGATGVGKTELAKSLADLLFGDERALVRFDMSEYKEEHAAEKLTGAPPGFVGYEEGGQLTNAILRRPYCILLFDEIEKAHPKLFDKFLQILEDERLTDGKGQTVYFNQTIIIFTSNIGASDLSDPQTGEVIRHGIMHAVAHHGADQFSYEQVEAHFRAEVEWYFNSRLGRAELLNRIGQENVIAFDLLRPEFVTRIGEKFLRTLTTSAIEKHQVQLQAKASVLEVLQAQMVEGANLLYGGRRIKMLLENLVERPLNNWIFERYPDLRQLVGKTLVYGLLDDTRLAVQER